MATFTIGQLELTVQGHVRVRGENFPRPDPGMIGEYFTVSARFNGNPIDFYPNQSLEGDTHNFGFIGREVKPIYNEDGTQQIGTKRGADFRTRFFRIVVGRIAKAVLAQQLGITLGAVTNQQIGAAPLAMRRLLGFENDRFADPIDLLPFTVDTAVERLTGSLPVFAEQVPAGTSLPIEVAYDAYSSEDGASESETGTFMTAARNSTDTFAQRRAQVRFSLSGIPTGSTINDSIIQANKTSESVAAGEDVAVRLYNSTGDDDPDADAATVRYTRSGSGSILASLVGNGTGSVSVDLTATADTAIQGNITTPGFISFGLDWDPADWDNGDSVIFQTDENAGTDPATLTVDYTAPVNFQHYGRPHGELGQRQMTQLLAT